MTSAQGKHNVLGVEPRSSVQAYFGEYLFRVDHRAFRAQYAQQRAKRPEYDIV